MTLQKSGPISILDIANEFGGSAPHSLSEYYAGGAYVPAGTKNKDGILIPSSGAITLEIFYGASKYIIPTVRNPLSPVPRGENRSYYNTGGQTSFNIMQNGTWNTTGNYHTNNGNWLLTGNATDVEVLITPTVGTFNYNDAANWVNASGVTAYVNSNTATRTKSCTFTVRFREKSTGTILSTTTGCYISTGTLAGDEP